MRRQRRPIAATTARPPTVLRTEHCVCVCVYKCIHIISIYNAVLVRRMQCKVAVVVAPWLHGDPNRRALMLPNTQHSAPRIGSHVFDAVDFTIFMC